MDYKEVTETIIGCAYRVYNKIKLMPVEARRRSRYRGPVKFMSMTAKRISLGNYNWSITLLPRENL